MTLNATLAAYPRLNDHETDELAQRLVTMSINQLKDESSTELAGAGFYHLAMLRVTESHIILLQAGIREIAGHHGYPEALPPGAKRNGFDAELTWFLVEQMPMIPADAADSGVWSFLSLRVCPDVAAWRFPKTLPDDETGTLPKLERYVGAPRNVFRRLWWRGHVLDPSRVERLIEDALVQVTERPAIGGYGRLARKLVDRYLSLLERIGDAKQQEIMRQAAKFLLRRMGVTSVYALDDAELGALIDEVLSEAVIAARGAAAEDLELKPDAEVDHIGAVDLITDRGVEVEFLGLCRDYRPFVEPLLRDPSDGQMLQVMELVRGYRDQELMNSPLAESIAERLEQLFDAWEQYDEPAQQRVVFAAAQYFVRQKDAIPDNVEDGLTDDEVVTNAALIALGRS